MKRVIKIFSLFAIILSICGCEDPVVEANFEDMESMSIYDFIVENDSLYGTFLDIMNAGEIAKTMSAYNPYAEGYTMFLPDSLAVVDFIANSSQYATLDDLLNDKEYCAALSRYHIVDLAIDANDFPFGALPSYTLSKDYLTINFVIEPDTSYYKVNNQAPVSVENIEVSNGFIHVISKVLIPITYTSYAWIDQHEGFSIFKDAIDATGFEEILSANLKEEENELSPVTMLVEPDSIFNKFDIYSFDDLVDRISPDNSDYTEDDNPLYNFIGYHILEGSRFLDDFSGYNTNYSTYSQIPLNIYDLSIDNEGFDIAINKEKLVFDTIFQKEDTILIDYIKFLYDESNVLTQSGAIHFVDQLLEQQPPERKEQWFSFWEEPLFNEYREEPGEYIIEDTASLDWVKWSGADLVFIKSSDEEYKASNQDYVYLDGDFSVSYTIPKVVQGDYTIYLSAERLNVANALIEVFLDGKKIGGLIDLSTGGTADWPYRNIELGDVNFPDYSHHTITVRSLIPGRFCWDQVHIEPLINEYEDEK
jgi:uncharacterized surface protein with fasciclin (FAS1) repeats